MRFHPFLLITTLGLTLYLPIFFTGFAGDDYPHFHVVEKNYATDFLAPFTHVIGKPAENHLLGYFYRPLPFVLYAILTTSFGATNALPFHVLQVILYLTCAFLFFLFCKRFFSERIALLLGLIFLIHPANNDLGAYIAALNETLCLLFGMITLLSIRKNPTFFSLGMTFTAVLLSLFSKESGILFAAIAGLYAYYKKTYAYIFSVISGLSVYLFFRVNAAENPVYTLTPSPTADLSFIQHLLLAPQIASAFLREIVMPTRAAIKPDSFAFTWEDSLVPLIIFLLFFLACIKLLLFLKKQKRHLADSFAFFFYWSLLGIPLHLQFIPLEVIFADRWLYITELGLLGMLGVALSTLPVSKTRWVATIRILFLILLCIYALETLILNFMWHNWEKYFI